MPSLKDTAPIFLEIFLTECCTVLVKPPMMSSLDTSLLSFCEAHKNLNISKTKKDILKRKMIFFDTLKALSDRQQLFFTS